MIYQLLLWIPTCTSFSPRKTRETSRLAVHAETGSASHPWAGARDSPAPGNPTSSADLLKRNTVEHGLVWVWLSQKRTEQQKKRVFWAEDVPPKSHCLLVAVQNAAAMLTVTTRSCPLVHANPPWELLYRIHVSTVYVHIHTCISSMVSCLPADDDNVGGSWMVNG